MNKRLWVIQKFAFDQRLELDGLIMKIINKDDDRPVGCAVNYLYKAVSHFEQVCAGKCNCGGTHQIFDDKVVWNKNIPSKDLSSLLLEIETNLENSLLRKLF